MCELAVIAYQSILIPCQPIAEIVSRWLKWLVGWLSGEYGLNSPGLHVTKSGCLVTDFNWLIYDIFHLRQNSHTVNYEHWR